METKHKSFRHETKGFTEATRDTNFWLHGARIHEKRCEPRPV